VRALCACLGAAALIPGVAVAQDNTPITIGMIYAKEGPAAVLAKNLVEGTELAVDDVGGKVLGRPIKLVWLDEQSPQEAVQNTLKLIDQYKITALMGGTISSNAIGMAAVAARKKIPYIATNAAVAQITGRTCNRYTFRTQESVPVQVNMLLPYLKTLGDKWYFLTPSYAFGQDIVKSARSKMKQFGAIEVGDDQVPFNTADYTSYILKIRQAKPSLVFGGLVGGDLSNFIKQWSAMGMKNEIPYTAIGVSDSDFWDVGPKAASGIYVNPWYYKDPHNSPQAKKFVQDFIAKYKMPPTDKAWQGWISTVALLQSIESAHSTQPAAVVTALEHWKDHNGAGTGAYFRSWDHQMIHQAVIFRVKKHITDAYDYFDVLQRAPASMSDVTAAYGTQAEVGCQMGPL
jgi:branched-chain amino acid transport system substrate-binding protein